MGSEMCIRDSRIAEYFNQNVKTYEFEPWLGLISPNWWIQAHPTIVLDWTVIRSYIISLSAYRKLRTEREYGELVNPFIKGQVARIILDGALKEYKYLDESGRIRLSIPYFDVQKKIKVDSFGLELEINKPLPAGWELYYSPSDYWTTMLHTDRIRIYEGPAFRVTYFWSKNEPETGNESYADISIGEWNYKEYPHRFDVLHKHHPDTIKVYYCENYIVSAPPRTYLPSDWVPLGWGYVSEDKVLEWHPLT